MSRPGRSVAAGLIGLVAVLLVPAALLAFWVGALLTRTDTFVETVRPVATTPEVQTAIAGAATTTVVKQLPLPDALAERVRGPVHDAVVRVVTSPDFEPEWVTSTTSLHEQFITAMRGEPGAELDGSGGISLSLTIPVKPLVEALAPFPLTVPDALHPVVAIPIVEPGQVADSRRYYRLADTAGVWAPFVLLGLGALSVALASRRRRAAIWVLLGSGLLAAATAGGALLARDTVVASVADPAGRTIVTAAYPVLIRGFLVEAGVIAVLCVLLALVVGALPHRDRDPGGRAAA
ncbi:MAG: hypothetical protein ABIS35_06175 [Terracoccus sp.]